MPRLTLIPTISAIRAEPASARHRSVFLLAAVSLAGCCCLARAARGDDRQAALPQLVQDYLVRALPDVARAIAEDDDLLREVGAKSPADLANATIDFSREVRVFQLDTKSLAQASEFGEALAPTDQYCMPYCVNGRCQTLMCLHYDGEANRTSLMSVGRSAQAARLADALGRFRRLLPGAARPQILVTLGEREFLHARDASGDGEYLVPLGAAARQAAALLTLAEAKAMAADMPEAPAVATPRTLLASQLTPPKFEREPEARDDAPVEESATEASLTTVEEAAQAERDANLRVEMPPLRASSRSMAERALLVIVAAALFTLHVRSRRREAA